MKIIWLLVAGIFGLTAQTPPQPAASVRHLVYQFGYNTKAAASGDGTGTTTVDILGPGKDGGVLVRASDHWWNTVRPRAENTCELHAGGGVSCTEPPYAISPVQLTLLPLLATGVFESLASNATSSWSNTYQVKAAVVPGAAGFAGQLYTWTCSYALQGHGAIANANPLVLVETTGRLEQQGGRYLRANSKQRIAYDPVAKIPVMINDTRTHLPAKSVYNNDTIELKLVSASR